MRERERERCARNVFTRVVIYFWYHLLLYTCEYIIRIVFAPRSEHPFIFLNADCLFSLQKASEKTHINKKRTFIHALRNVDILSVAHDSAGWFSLSFDDDDDLIVEDDDEDDDG